MKIIFTALLILLIPTFSNLFAQNWHSLGPAGAPISICVSSKYILAGTWNSGIMKSTDNGNTWKYVQGIPYGSSPNNAVMCIEHDPQNLQNVYAGEGPDETATGNGFFKSTDGGETWQAKNSGLGWWPAIREISISPFHPYEIYAYCRSNGGPSIYKSTDYGETWNLFFHVDEDGALCSAIVFNEKDSTAQFAFDVNGSIHQWKNGVYSLLESSKNFFSTGYPVLTFLNSETGSFFYANGSNLYKRTSDSDWVSILNNIQTDSIKFNSIISADVDQQSGTIYVCTDKGVLISSNDGDNWLVNKDLNDMKVTVDSSRTILIGLKGLYSSVDSGSTWSKLSNGLNISMVNKSSVVSKAGKITIYFLGNDNTFSGSYLFKTTDEGVSWTTIDLLDKVPNIVKANPLNPDIVYIGCSYAPNMGLYKSCDGGNSWKQIKSDISVSSIELLPNDTSHILIGSEGGIFESFDSGNSWDSLLSDMKDIYYKINVIKVSRKNPVMMCVGLWSNYVNKSGFYISTDGSFWERKMNGITDNIDNVDVSAVAIDPKNDNNIFIGNRSGVYRTTDMGSHWLLCNSIGYVSDIEIAPDNPDMILATSGALTYDESGTGLYLSQDGGNSWERITFTGLLDETRTSIDIIPNELNYKIFIGTKSYGYFEGEYPREILLPMQPIIISPSGVTNIERMATLIWHPSDLAMEYNIQISEDSLFASVAFDTTLKDTALQLSDTLVANTSYFWRVNAVNIYGDTSYSLTANFSTGTAVGVKDEMNGIPKVFALSQNYPNPFNPSTIINYEIPKSGLVTIKIYDVLGREISTLVNEIKNQGRYNLKFDGSNLASGLYFYRITSNNFTATKKMLLLK